MSARNRLGIHTHMAPNLFATALTKHRDLAGFSQKQLASRMGCSPSSVTRWEKGESIPKRNNAELLDSHTEAGGKVFAAWWDHTQGTGLPEWASSLAAIEEAAVSLSVASPVLPPGYLQSPSYAQHVFRTGLPLATPAEIDHRTKHRCERLDQLPDLRVTAVFPLDGITGVPPEIAANQAQHLMKWAGSERVTLHLVPAGHVMVVPTSPIMLFRMRDGELVATSDHADGSVTLKAGSHERISALFSASLAASLPARFSLEALKEIADARHA